MRQPPNFFSQLMALVLGGIGVAFVLLGALFTWMDLPVQGCLLYTSPSPRD